MAKTGKLIRFSVAFSPSSLTWANKQQLVTDVKLNKHLQNSLFALLISNSLEAGTKVGPDQLGLPFRVGSTRIDSDRLGSWKNVKLNEILKLLPIRRLKLRSKMGRIKKDSRGF